MPAFRSDPLLSCQYFHWCVLSQKIAAADNNADLDAFLERTGNADSPAASYIRSMGLLPAGRPAPRFSRPEDRESTGATPDTPNLQEQQSPLRSRPQRSKEKGRRDDHQSLLRRWPHRRVRHGSHDRRRAAAGQPAHQLYA